jgi:hypothetical protein
MKPDIKLSPELPELLFYIKYLALNAPAFSITLLSVTMFTGLCLFGDETI